MITQDQAEYLLKLPKRIIKGEDIPIDLKIEKNLFELYSPDDDEWKFSVQIFSNKKIIFRISVHHLEENSKEGLLRVDFKAGHRNPETVNSFVPDFLKPYTGKWFQNESHIHLFVESYKNLAWAIPLKDYEDFPVKGIESYSDFSDALICFSRKINLLSYFTFQGPVK